MLYQLKRKRLLFSSVVPIIGACLMTVSPAIQAERSYLTTWGGLYQSSLSDDNAECALCHTTTSGSGGGLNPYGVDIRDSSAGAIENRIQDPNVESADSDGDPGSFTNLEEINANTQPGWTNGDPISGVGDLDPPVANLPPVADAGGSYTGTVGEPVFFNGSGSSDEDGTVDQYDWNYGDGTLAPNAGPTPSHTYAAADTYTVSLTVMDNSGDTDTDTTTASIAAAPEDPIAVPGGPYAGSEGVALAFDGSASFDPDGGLITQWFWDFGDGNNGTGSNPSHTYAAANTYTVTLTVEDDEGVLSGPATTEAVIGADQDGDGVADADDNCILVPNGPVIPDAGGNSQLDTNGDGFGNICDPDFDGDNVVNAADLSMMKSVFFLDPNPNPDVDLDGDGIVNAADLSILKSFFFQAPGPSGLVP